MIFILFCISCGCICGREGRESGESVAIRAIRNRIGGRNILNDKKRSRLMDNMRISRSLFYFPD